MLRYLTDLRENIQREIYRSEGKSLEGNSENGKWCTEEYGSEWGELVDGVKHRPDSPFARHVFKGPLHVHPVGVQKRVPTCNCRPHTHLDAHCPLPQDGLQEHREITVSLVL